MLLVVCRLSCPLRRLWGLMDRKASMTTFPRTDWIGSTTTATQRGLSCSKDYIISFVQPSRSSRPSARMFELTCCVFTSTLLNQHPNPG